MEKICTHKWKIINAHTEGKIKITEVKCVSCGMLRTRYENADLRDYYVKSDNFVDSVDSSRI